MEQQIPPDEPISIAVVEAVGSLLGRDPTTLRPLAEILDPDALDALFTHQVGDPPMIGGRVTFVYEGCRVTVEAGEYLVVEQIDLESRPPGDIC